MRPGIRQGQHDSQIRDAQVIATKQLVERIAVAHDERHRFALCKQGIPRNFV
ncbi:hypothetical protein D3C83_131570 [compost metagenome]